MFFFKVDRCVPMYRSGRPDEFVKELPYTYVAQLISSKLIHNFNPWKRSPKIYATFVIFKKTAHMKQSPNRRKFAQSARLGTDPQCYRYVKRRHTQVTILLCWSKLSYDFWIYSYNASVVVGQSVFSKWKKILFKTDSIGYSWRCKFLQRWRCNSRSLDPILRLRFTTPAL
jgi:hypothetical protein